MVPGWVALLLAAPTMFIIARHILSISSSDLDLSRRRLRIGNGLLMMFITALLAYALGVTEVPDQPRTNPAAARLFVMLWTVIVGLLAVVVALAVLDALVTTRTSIRERNALRREVDSHHG